MKQVIYACQLWAVLALALLCGAMMAPKAQAQEQVWLQIEAQPTLAEAEERARAYAGVFSDVGGFQMASGWYAIVLGPMADRAAATDRLAALKREGMIPRDSFLADTRIFRDAFWPVGVAPAVPEAAEIADPLMNAPVVEAPAVEEPVVEAPAEPAAPLMPVETLAEAKAAEAALTTAERQALQTALQWYGFYSARIDGAFGPGTRKSMAAWQEANAQEPTGVLSTLQRETLLAAYGQAQAELGLETITEPEAGIEITLPMALVQFDHYEPPFVHFAAKDGSDVRVILISQPGDQSTLYGLYDILQTLEVVPLDGERARGERNFTLTGRNGSIASHSYAELSKGLVKGYMLIWNPQDDERMTRVLAAMQASFRAVGDRALDPGLVPMSDDSRKGLLSGLEVRRPALSRTGFYVDQAGAVLTTVEAVDQCDRITLDLGPEADLVASDAGLGLALLTPKKPLSPQAVAELLTSGTPRVGSEVAVSGYSYEDTLPAPTLTFGTLEDDKGLDGELGLARLSLAALAGDAGGPVLDGAGTVLGMLLPRASDAARQLPAEVGHAAQGAAIAGWLQTAAGITARASTRQGALAPEDLTRLAEGMTVLVSCWK